MHVILSNPTNHQVMLDVDKFSVSFETESVLLEINNDRQLMNIVQKLIDSNFNCHYSGTTIEVYVVGVYAFDESCENILK